MRLTIKIEIDIEGPPVDGVLLQNMQRTLNEKYAMTRIVDKIDPEDEYEIKQWHTNIQPWKI